MSKYSDEKLDEMLSNLLGTEIPDDMLFHEKLTGEVQVSVKKLTDRRRIFLRTCAAFAAAVCIAFPSLIMLNNSNVYKDKAAPGIADLVSDTELDAFNDARNKYSFECIKLESSSFYRDFTENPYSENNTPETGLLLALGLIPYDLTETGGRELIVRTVYSGNKCIYTRQAYIAGYDENGDINFLMKSSEELSDDEEKIIEYSDFFKGDENAGAGFERTVSKFQSRGSKVKIDGITVRDETGSDAEYSVSSGDIYACIKNDGKLVPLRAFELYYEVNKKMPKTEDCPDFITVTHKKDMTSWYSVLMYDCTMTNSFRTEIKDKEIIWESE